MSGSKQTVIITDVALYMLDNNPLAGKDFLCESLSQIGLSSLKLQEHLNNKPDNTPVVLGIRASDSVDHAAHLIGLRVLSPNTPIYAIMDREAHVPPELISILGNQGICIIYPFAKDAEKEIHHMFADSSGIAQLLLASCKKKQGRLAA